MTQLSFDFGEQHNRNTAVRDLMPQKLQLMCEFLRNAHVQLSQVSPDGRINSAVSEQNVLLALIKRFPDIDIPDGKSRKWYDFSFRDEDGNFYPVNIKISKMSSTPDNVSSKTGVFYAITGIVPPKEYGWENFWDELHSNEHNPSNGSDYYFIIINKNDTSDVFCTSLKHLNEVRTNGNNFPFQCCWDKNRTLVDRTDEEAREFLLNTLKESVEKDTMARNYYRVYGNR